ncbi:MAG: hypothetical protein QW761_01735 [Candidatus Aenigmatarchaeota archaeon]
MCCKKTALYTGLVFVLALFLIFFAPSANAANICSYTGPDVSPHNLELSNFTIEGPQRPGVGEQIRVRFTLKNVGDKPINFTDKGVFVGAKVELYDNRQYGFSFQNQTLNPLQKVNFDQNITINETGSWVLWPSYEIWVLTSPPPPLTPTWVKIKGPDMWHMCNVIACPSYCENGIRYYNGYINQEGLCSYLQEACELGCDEQGKDCLNVSRIEITQDPVVEITQDICKPLATVRWRTNIDGRGTVFYREFGSSEWKNVSTYSYDNTSRPSLRLRNLKLNTTYYYYVKSCGPDDCVQSAQYQFTTPVTYIHIESVNVSATMMIATISWKTHCYDVDETPSEWNLVLTNYTLFVTPTAYVHLPNPPWSNVSNSTYNNTHTANLSGMLEEGRNYTFFIRACYRDSDLCADSARYTFVTQERPFPEIIGLRTEVTHTSVDIHWNTFQIVNTTVYLIKNQSTLPNMSSWMRTSNSSYRTDHSAHFSYLKPGTTYVFVIEHCGEGRCNKTAHNFVATLSCFDGIRNGDEHGVDCGGPCEAECIECTWCGDKIIPVYLQGPPEEKIDIVFVASNTSWDWFHRAKVAKNTYSSNRSAFISVVRDLIQNWYLELNTLVSEPIPSNFRERFNFYYYWDNRSFGDAFDGCAGRLPEGFWTDAPFADVGGILYPPHWVSGVTEAGGCANALGPPSQFKGPGFNGYVTIHESGHAVFGLVDEYCGNTTYSQNDPLANVWGSLENCTRDVASTTKHDPSNCRQIMWDDSRTSGVDCTRNWWRWNPDPEIMECACGKFGPMCVRHINYMFESSWKWRR